MKLVAVSEMKGIEGQADTSGLTYAQMIDNAARCRRYLSLPHDVPAGGDSFRLLHP